MDSRSTQNICEHAPPAKTAQKGTSRRRPQNETAQLVVPNKQDNDNVLLFTRILRSRLLHSQQLLFFVFRVPCRRRCPASEHPTSLCSRLRRDPLHRRYFPAVPLSKIDLTRGASKKLAQLRLRIAVCLISLFVIGNVLGEQLFRLQDSHTIVARHAVFTLLLPYLVGQVEIFG